MGINSSVRNSLLSTGATIKQRLPYGTRPRSGRLGRVLVLCSAATLVLVTATPTMSSAQAQPAVCNTPVDAYTLSAATLAACGWRSYPRQDTHVAADGSTTYTYNVERPIPITSPEQSPHIKFRRARLMQQLLLPRSLRTMVYHPSLRSQML